MTTIEGNKLIAEFMGAKHLGKEMYDGVGYEMFDFHQSFPIKLSSPDDFGYKRTGYLGFDCQWDWLMPVVDKIEELGYYTNIMLSEDNHSFYVYNEPTYRRSKESSIICYVDFSYKVKIDAVWSGVIEFIQWHNSQKQP